MNRKKLFSLLFVLCLCVINGCSGLKEPYVSVQQTNEPEDETGLSESDDEAAITIYTIDYSNIECRPTVSVLDDGSLPDAARIIEEVVVNFKEEVIVTDISETKDSITVKFSDKAAPIVKVSEPMEMAMLDCIAYSLLDNLEYCNEVYFITNEDGYLSTYNSWAHDEPYVSK